MSELSTINSWRPGKLLHRLLFAYAAVLGIETGAAAFVTVVVFPLWTASPEAVIKWTPESPFYLEEGDLFMYTSPLTFILCVGTLIAGWKAIPPLRFWLRLATVLFLIVFIVSVIYFIPIQAVVKGEAGTKIPTEELGGMLQTFVLTNYLRFVTLLVALGCALHALGLSYRMRFNAVV